MVSSLTVTPIPGAIQSLILNSPVIMTNKINKMMHFINSPFVFYQSGERNNCMLNDLLCDCVTAVSFMHSHGTSRYIVWLSLI